MCRCRCKINPAHRCIFPIPANLLRTQMQTRSSKKQAVPEKPVVSYQEGEEQVKSKMIRSPIKKNPTGSAQAGPMGAKAKDNPAKGPLQQNPMVPVTIKSAEIPPKGPTQQNPMGAAKNTQTKEQNLGAIPKKASKEEQDTQIDEKLVKKFSTFSEDKLGNYWKRIEESGQSLIPLMNQLCKERQEVPFDDQEDYMNRAEDALTHVEEYITALTEIAQFATFRGWKYLVQEIKEKMTKMDPSTGRLSMIISGTDPWSIQQKQEIQAMRNQEKEMEEQLERLNLSNKKIIRRQEELIRSQEVKPPPPPFRHEDLLGLEEETKGEKDKIPSLYNFNPRYGAEYKEDEDSEDDQYQRGPSAMHHERRREESMQGKSKGRRDSGHTNSVPVYKSSRRNNPGDDPSSSSSEDGKGRNKNSSFGTGKPGKRTRENQNIIPVSRNDPIQFGSKSYMKPPILSHEANPHDHGLWKSKFKGWFVDGGGTLCSPSQQLTILTTCLNGELTTKMYALYRHESIPVNKTGKNDRCMMDGLTTSSGSIHSTLEGLTLSK